MTTARTLQTRHSAQCAQVTRLRAGWTLPGVNTTRKALCSFDKRSTLDTTTQLPQSLAHEAECNLYEPNEWLQAQACIAIVQRRTVLSA